MKNTNKGVLSISLAVILALLLLVICNFDLVQKSVDAAYAFLINEFGWFFILSSLIALIFSLFIAFGPYRNVKMGGKDAKPAFSTLSWAAMMFTTSCGAWLVVYGFLEPVYCAADPAFQAEALSIQGNGIGADVCPLPLGSQRLVYLCTCFHCAWVSNLQ